MSNIVEISNDPELTKAFSLIRKHIDRYDNLDDPNHSDTDESLDDREECNDDEIIFLLNTLGQVYDSVNGFDKNVTICFDEEFDKCLIETFINEAEEEEYHESNDDNYEYVNIDIDFYIDKSEFKVPYSTVIINYEKSYPISRSYGEKWISINENTNTIKLCSDLKGSALTLEDILYASRIIADTMYQTEFTVELDKHRYKIISNNYDILTLQY
jgi:hypothetical protein